DVDAPALEIAFVPRERRAVDEDLAVIVDHVEIEHDDAGRIAVPLDRAAIPDRPRVIESLLWIDGPELAGRIVTERREQRRPLRRTRNQFEGRSIVGHVRSSRLGAPMLPSPLYGRYFQLPARSMRFGATALGAAGDLTSAGRVQDERSAAPKISPQSAIERIR